MVSSFPRILIFLMMASLHVFAEDMQKNREREAARAVIMRTVPSLAASPEKLHLETIEKEDGYDVFETKASGGVLTIQGSSGTALCRGFYDFLKTNRLGMVSWENKDIRWPAQLPDTAPRRRSGLPHSAHSSEWRSCATSLSIRDSQWETTGFWPVQLDSQSKSCLSRNLSRAPTR